MKKTIFITVVLLLGAPIFLQPVSKEIMCAESLDFVPGPTLTTPIKEEVDLRGKDFLTFKWKLLEGDSMRRRYHDFRLYKGYDMLESVLIFKKEVPSTIHEITVKADLFENNQVYTWSVREICSNYISDRSFSSFKVIKNKNRLL